MHQTDGIFVFPINFFREALAIFFLYQRSISNLISSSSYRGAGNLILKPLFLQKSGVLGAAAGQWETPTTTHLGSNYEAEMQRCLSSSSSSSSLSSMSSSSSTSSSTSPPPMLSSSQFAYHHHHLDHHPHYPDDHGQYLDADDHAHYIYW